MSYDDEDHRIDPIKLASELEDTPIDPEVIPKAKGYRLLIKDWVAAKVSKGGIIMTDISRDAEQHLNYIGEVIDMGPECYRHPKFHGCDPWVKVGDLIIFGRCAGQVAVIGSTKFRFVNDDDVLGVVKDPSVFKIYS